MSILHVDGNAAVRRAIYALLRRAGHEVLQAGHGREAILMAREHQPDLVITEVTLPGITGITVCRQLRALPTTADIPVIMLSARAYRSQVVESLKAGALDYMVKGRLRPADILARIERVMQANPREPCQQESSPRPTPGPGPRPGPIQLVSRSELTRLIEERASLKAMPFVLAEILAIIGDEESSAAALVRAIERDPAVSAQVLRLANSALYARRGRITSLAESVQRIGFSGVRNLTVALGVVNDFASEEVRGLDRFQFWLHSLAVGVFAREIAQHNGREADLAFVAGLLHDLGKAFFGDCLGEQYDQVLAHERTEGERLTALEKASFGLHHAAVGERLLLGWNLPETLSMPILQHHATPDRILSIRDEHVRFTTAALVAANLIVKACEIGHSGDDWLEDIGDPLAEVLGIDTAWIVARLDTVRSQVSDLLRILLLHADPETLERVRDLDPAPCAADSRVHYVDYAPPRLDPVAIALSQVFVQVDSAKRLALDPAGVPDVVLLHARTAAHLDRLREDAQALTRSGHDPSRVCVLNSTGQKVGLPDPPVRIDLPRPAASLLEALRGFSRR